MMRWLHRVRAALGGYFWLPCDICGLHFGGHERGWKPRNVDVPGDRLLCPVCARWDRALRAAESRINGSDRTDGSAER